MMLLRNETRIVRLVCCLLCCSSATTTADDVYLRDACPSRATIELSSDGQSFTDEQNRIEFPAALTWFTNGSTYGCICDVKLCLRLCCPLGQIARQDRCVKDGTSTDVALQQVLDSSSLDEAINDTFVFNGVPCVEGSGFLLNSDYEDEEWHLLENGSLSQPMNDLTPLVLIHSYCFYIGVNESSYVPRICFDPYEMDPHRRALSIGTLISVPFLVVTFLVYVALPELKNIHGLTLRSYVGGLSVGFVVMSFVRLRPRETYSMATCKFLGYSMQFSFLVSFFWLNVMCFDIWFTLRNFASGGSGNENLKSRKFLYYSIYAWGLAVLLSGFTILVDVVPAMSDVFVKPGIGIGSCFFESKEADALYFYGPLSITLFINIIFFSMTTIHLVKHERQMGRQLNGTRHQQHKSRFALYMRLFIVMGVNWTMDFLSWLWTGPELFWYCTDMVNALQGVLIFVMLVWKDKIKRSIVKRLRDACRSCSPKMSSEDPIQSTSTRDWSSSKCQYSHNDTEEFACRDQA